MNRVKATQLSKDIINELGLEVNKENVNSILALIKKYGIIKEGNDKFANYECEGQMSIFDLEDLELEDLDRDV